MRATDTADVRSAISVATSSARGSTCAAGSSSRTSPAASASSAPNVRPVTAQSTAVAMPTMRGRNQVAHDSGTMPRRVNGRAKRLPSAPMRTSIGRTIVTPIPTAVPLIAAITGLREPKIRSASSPPTSRVPPRSGLKPGGVGVVAAGTGGEVRPRREELPRSGDDHRADLVVGVDAGEHVEQRVEHLVGDRVPRLRPVDRDDGDAAPPAGEDDGAVDHQLTSAIVVRGRASASSLRTMASTSVASAGG